MALFCLLLLVFACGKQQLVAPELAASVGGRDILYSEFESYVASSVGEPAAGLESAVLSRLLDRCVEEESLILLAQERGILGTRRSAVDGLLAEETESVVDRQAIASYYESHSEEFSLPPRVRLMQILVEEREIADRAARELADGADFAEVATRVSADPAAGDQGYLVVEDLPPVFANLVAGLSPGEISEVVEAEYGFHIFLVTESLPEMVLSIEEAEASIRASLQRAALDQAFERLVAEAQGRYDLVIHVQNLPFDYLPSPVR